MNKITIFLASSNELQFEREQFEIQIYRKCKAWIDRGIFLHLEIWEDLSARMSATRSQDEYNRKIAESDIFVLLAYNKVGMYTAEEFEQAFGRFQETRKPFIFTYFKDTQATSDASLQAFKERLISLDHFYTQYIGFDDLWRQFNLELDRLELAGFKLNVHRTASGNSRSIIQGDKSVYIENAKDVRLTIK
ncbi:hypothetical protein KEF85_10740 [Methylomonas paludis]|uniref:DUF4062 domain-containing protein n=1 Tax=Methylomonas paludis TaxID=1173101 RepID=A0A975MKZ7_9GAMM|nr:hypothetical protein [Methylomonas paludis]QWF69838.1 hypothetical protein KEF85_10740 [Methylomonas paludis]